MNCYLSAILGFGLLGASFYTSNSSDNQNSIYKQNLPPESIDIYEKIVNERATLYLEGLLLGFIFVFFINYFYSSNFNNNFHKITFFILVILLTGVVFYTLMPKSNYMLNYVSSNSESKAWLEMYKTMKYRYNIGFILGSLASIPLANSFC